MPVFEPTIDQLRRAAKSIDRYVRTYLRADPWTPREWAVKCLQDEWLNRRALAKW